MKRKSNLKTKAQSIMKAIAKRKARKLDSTIRSVKLFRNGNYTVALLNNNTVGVAKFNPEDEKFNDSTGTNLALYRAVNNFMNS